MTLVAISLPLMALVAVGDTWTILIPGFLVGGIGIGMVNPALASTAVGVVEPRRSGMASGINSTFRQVGIATGIAGLGAVFREQIETGVVDQLHGSPVPVATAKQIASGVASGGDVKGPAEVSNVVAKAIETAFVSSFDTILYIAAGVAAVGAIAAWVMVHERDIFQHGHAPAGDAGAAPTPAVESDRS
jgi:hypothetical protein